MALRSRGHWHQSGPSPRRLEAGSGFYAPIACSRRAAGGSLRRQAKRHRRCGPDVAPGTVWPPVLKEGRRALSDGLKRSAHLAGQIVRLADIAQIAGWKWGAECLGSDIVRRHGCSRRHATAETDPYSDSQQNKSIKHLSYHSSSTARAIAPISTGLKSVWQRNPSDTASIVSSLTS